MALRIGMPNMSQIQAVSEPYVDGEEPINPESATPAMAQPVETEPLDMMDPASMMAGGGTVEKTLVHYLGPERIEMACKNCIHFMEPGTCDIVAGGVDPEGTCNLFVMDSGGEEEMPQELDTEVLTDNTGAESE